MGMEIVYQRSGDYLFPVEKGALTEVKESLKMKKTDGISETGRLSVQETSPAEETMETQPGKYAKMREDYLIENRSILYQALLISGELDAHLEETEQTAQKRMEELMEALMVKYPAPDRADTIAWTAHRNSLTEMAEETVRSEIIYR